MPARRSGRARRGRARKTGATWPIRWESMRTLVLGPLPAETERFVERRKALGQGTYDEVWEGTYHISPAPRGTHG